MAIAFDASSNGGIVNPGTSLTWSHTCTGDDRLLLVWHKGSNGGSDVVTGVTYNGVAMTKVGSSIQVSGDRWGALWYLLNPASGANNVVISSASDVILGKAASYTGVKQTDFPDSSNTGTASATSITVSTTTVANNCWVAMGVNDNGQDQDAGANTTDRFTGVTGPDSTIMDSNGVVTPAGSRSLVATHAVSGAFAAVIVSFAPVAVATSTPTRLLMGIGT